METKVEDNNEAKEGTAERAGRKLDKKAWHITPGYIEKTRQNTITEDDLAEFIFPRKLDDKDKGSEGYKELLKRKPNGTFLMRESSENGCDLVVVRETPKLTDLVKNESVNLYIINKEENIEGLFFFDRVGKSLTRVISDGCDLVKMSEIPTKTNLERTYRHQYIMTEMTKDRIYFFDATRQKITEWKFVDDKKTLSSLLEKLNFNGGRRRADSGSLDVITSYTKHVIKDEQPFSSFLPNFGFSTRPEDFKHHHSLTRKELDLIKSHTAYIRRPEKLVVSYILNGNVGESQYNKESILRGCNGFFEKLEQLKLDRKNLLRPAEYTPDSYIGPNMSEVEEYIREKDQIDRDPTNSLAEFSKILLQLQRDILSNKVDQDYAPVLERAKELLYPNKELVAQLNEEKPFRNVRQVLTTLINALPSSHSGFRAFLICPVTEMVYENPCYLANTGLICDQEALFNQSVDPLRRESIITPEPYSYPRYEDERNLCLVKVHEFMEFCQTKEYIRELPNSFFNQAAQLEKANDFMLKHLILLLPHPDKIIDEVKKRKAANPNSRELNSFKNWVLDNAAFFLQDREKAQAIKDIIKEQFKEETSSPEIQILQ